MKKEKRETLDEQLRREESIKTEVIVELKNHNKALINANIRTIEALVSQTNYLIENLKVVNHYRTMMLNQSRIAVNDTSHCLENCSRHEWSREDGWKRKKNHDE